MIALRTIQRSGGYQKCQVLLLYTSGSPLTSDMTDRFVRGGRFLEKPYSVEQLGLSVGELLH